MTVTVTLYIGKPYREGDPFVCCKCGKALKNEPGGYDEMRDEGGNRYLYCEQCTVEMFTGAQIHTDH